MLTYIYRKYKINYYIKKFCISHYFILDNLFFFINNFNYLNIIIEKSKKYKIIRNIVLLNKSSQFQEIWELLDIITIWLNENRKIYLSKKTLEKINFVRFNFGNIFKKENYDNFIKVKFNSKIYFYNKTLSKKIYFNGILDNKKINYIKSYKNYLKIKIEDKTLFFSKNKFKKFTIFIN